MVARGTPSSDGLAGVRDSLPGRLFDAWRRLLTLLAHAALRASRIVILMATGQASAEELPIATAVRVAAVAIAIGVGAATAVGTSSHGLVPALASALVSAAWVLARLVVMRVRGAEVGVATEKATLAWASGTLFFAFAATPLLRIAAWTAGALTSYRALDDGPERGAGARSTVVWGYGIEALGILVVWLLGSLAILAYL